MSETSDWKQKYRDALLEAEADEKQWREVERVLRRLIGRLCAAGMGVDRQLDEELTALAAANRRNAAAAELERLAQSLTSAVVAVDATSPVPQLVLPPLPAAPPAKVQRWASTCAALGSLLERLKAGESDTAVLENLTAQLATAAADAELATIVARTADLIHERGEALARERLRAAAVLSEVTVRLEEMAGFLTESNSASRSHFDDSQSLNDNVMSHVRELTDEVSAATELGMLQSVVSARLTWVAKQFTDFRAREVTRMAEYNGRAEHMRERIADLEREAQELHSKLDREKHGARLDPLTGVANRKSFDERFAQEITRRAPALRASDYVARFGGEEFAVLLGGLGLVEAENIANQVRTAVEGLRFHFRKTPVHITVSCGITELHQDDAPEAAFERADAALYRAKNGGKNLCVAA